MYEGSKDISDDGVIVSDCFISALIRAKDLKFYLSLDDDAELPKDITPEYLIGKKIRRNLNNDILIAGVFKTDYKYYHEFFESGQMEFRSEVFAFAEYKALNYYILWICNETYLPAFVNTGSDFLNFSSVRSASFGLKYNDKTNYISTRNEQSEVYISNAFFPHIDASTCYLYGNKLINQDERSKIVLKVMK